MPVGAVVLVLLASSYRQYRGGVTLLHACVQLAPCCALRTRPVLICVLRSVDSVCEVLFSLVLSPQVIENGLRRVSGHSTVVGVVVVVLLLLLLSALWA